MITVGWAAWYPYVEEFVGQGEGETAHKDFWRRRVVPEFIEAVIGKLS